MGCEFTVLHPSFLRGVENRKQLETCMVCGAEFVGRQFMRKRPDGVNVLVCSMRCAGEMPAWFTGFTDEGRRLSEAQDQRWRDEESRPVTPEVRFDGQDGR